MSAESVDLTHRPNQADEYRTWLASVADLLIPASEVMPAASSVDIGGVQLDHVLRARPDLQPHLRRGWMACIGLSAEESVDLLPQLDPAAYDAVRIAVAGGYYMHEQVRALLGYTGQQPRQVRVDQIPEYVEEGLLERVLERGPLYRDA